MALLQTEFRFQALKRTVTDIQIKILNAMKENMPEISSDTLEEGGKVYYMNGKNGTEFNASGRAHDQHPFKSGKY